MTAERPELQDFPSLDRWGDELRDATKRREPRSARFRLPIRRITLAVAVMLLAVPGAIATRSIWVDPVDRVDPRRDPGSSPAVLLAEGRANGLTWQLGAYDRPDGERCVQIQSSMTIQDKGGGCSRPLGGPAQLTVGALSAHDVGFVYGSVTSRAASVRVTVPGGRTTITEAIEPDAETLRRAGLTERRVFVATFAGGIDPSAGPPLVVVLDDHGAEIGRMPNDQEDR